MAFTALFDACVLYPASLRDLLLRLARTNLFRARWSNDIHEEWIRNLRNSRPELAERLNRTRSFMDRAIEDCLVFEYHHLIPVLNLPDENDRHVLAAAIVGRADVIVTMNLKHFPEATLEPYKIEAQHPDVFIRHLLDLDHAIALTAVKEHRASLKAPSFSVEDYLDMLARQSLAETVTFLRPWAGLL